MCLGQLVEVVGPAGAGSARVRAGASEFVVSVLTLDGPVEPGEWLVVHSGFALGRIGAAEARDALALRSGRQEVGS